MAKFFIAFLALAIPLLINGVPVSESFQKLVNQAAGDFQHALKGTTSAVESLFEKNIAVAGFVGNTAAQAATTGTAAAVDYISAIDVEAALNKTEETILEEKIALIKGAFDVKRQALKLLMEAREDHKDTVIGLYNGTVDGLNLAFNTTANGIILTKETVANLTSEASISNAQSAVINAFNGTIEALENAGSAITQALVNTKLSLHNAAENFNSKDTIANTTSGIAGAVNITVTSAGTLVDQWGLFTAIDNLIHSLAAVPTKINNYINNLRKKPAATTEVVAAAPVAAVKEDMEAGPVVEVTEVKTEVLTETISEAVEAVPAEVEINNSEVMAMDEQSNTV